MTGDKHPNLHALPTVERDTMQASLDELVRILPQSAKVAKMMQEEFVKVGFTEDEALQLTAYAVFH